MTIKPSVRPARPWFSAGPTAKRPGYSLAGLPQNLLGRGIRAPEVVARFAEALTLTRRLLEVPEDFQMLYVPGSQTGAIEAALWGMLGEHPVQVVAFENFGKQWETAVKDRLKLEPEVLSAGWGDLPDLTRVDPKKDLVFPWNGTTAGVRVPNADFISADREGIVICDATSAAFGMPLDWAKVDVVGFSFQKALGGEAGIGVLCLSPRAVDRLDSYTPDRPLPKVLKLTDDKGRFDRALATGVVVNTMSVLTIEDWIDAVEWGLSVGGLAELHRRTDANFAVLEAWVERTPWIEFLANRPETRSTTSVCLKIVDPRVAGLDEAGRYAFVMRMKALLEAEGAAFDVESYRKAPAGLRLWCGPTVEAADVEAVTPWLDWAFETAVAELDA
ncbi:Phosphoserine aminotransferase [Brevundimonas sp. NIBR10]|uniref:phosphoserine transaminase n=1 Tax=Brevundimonas sp. NIBR10 TaxID=3015997 RepID=UPI0022F19BDD|nr:phosphoserine transaminase [Brevundimonas sp. NIBR10]WGM48722.1 Phosphoserine aminotransferase [Brevundimonas sp. NIBR10]